MARKKSAAKKHRERTGTYLSKLTFHVPVSDIIDILAVLLREDSKREATWTDQNAVVSAVARFLTDKGNEGLKWARKETGSADLVADEVYNRAAAVVEKHLSFMIPENDEEGDGSDSDQVEGDKADDSAATASGNGQAQAKKAKKAGSRNKGKSKKSKAANNATSEAGLTPQGEKWLKKHD